MNSKNIKASKYGIYTIVSVTLLLLILVALNLLVSLLPASVRRIDTTGLGLSKLSEETLDFIGELDADVTIAHVCITGEEEETVTDILEKYSENSDRINIVKVDPAVNPTYVSKYTDKTPDNNSLIVIGGDRAKLVEYNDLFTFALYYTDTDGQLIPQGEMSYSDFMNFFEYYSSYFGSYYSYDTLFAGENAISSAIDYVTSDSLPAVYCLTGHGESPLTDTLKDDLSLDNIDTFDLILTVSGIPENASCIVINAPISDISEKEAELLKDYLAKDGDLVLFTDAEYLDLPNLMALMSDYGLEAEQTYVCESRSYIGQIYMVIADASAASSTLDISGYSAVLPLAHPIYITEKNTDSGIAYIELFKSSSEAYTVDEFSDGENEGYDDSSKQVYDLGVMASIDNGDGIAHIVWVSTPGLVSDDVNNFSTGGNYVYFISLIEKLTNKGSSLAVFSKKMVEDSLVMSGVQSYFWAVVIIFAIPAAFLIAGIVVTVKRKRK